MNNTGRLLAGIVAVVVIAGAVSIVMAEPASVSASGPSSANPGDSVTFSFSLTNTGQNDSSYIIDYSVPSGWSIDSKSCGGGSESGTKCLYQTVSPGDTVSASVTVTVPDDASGSYTASVTGKDSEGVVGSDSTSISVETPTPTPTPTATPTPTPTPTATPTPTDTPEDTPTDTPTDTPEDDPGDDPGDTPTDTPEDTPTATPTPTPNGTTTPAPNGTATPTPTQTPTQSPTETPTQTPTQTPTSTQTPAQTPTSAPTPSQTPDSSPTATATDSPTATTGPTQTPIESPDTPSGIVPELPDMPSLSVAPKMVGLGSLVFTAGMTVGIVLGSRVL